MNSDYTPFPQQFAFDYSHANNYAITLSRFWIHDSWKLYWLLIDRFFANIAPYTFDNLKFMESVRTAWFIRLFWEFQIYIQDFSNSWGLLDLWNVLSKIDSISQSNGISKTPGLSKSMRFLGFLGSSRSLEFSKLL